MFKKSIAIVAIIIAGFLLASCSVASTPAPVSWDGTWISDPELMAATISGDNIEINIVSDGTSALYWTGTWPSTTDAVDGTQVTSMADVEALSVSLLGSQDTSKEFTYVDGQLNFEFSMMGVTKTIHLKK